jgi:hypothetical protein
MPEIVDFGGEQQYGRTTDKASYEHGHSVSSKIMGVLLGSAKNAAMIVPVRPDLGPTPAPGTFDGWNENQVHLWRNLYTMFEGRLEQYIRVMEDILDPNLDKRGRVVINVSNGVHADINLETPSYIRMLCKQDVDTSYSRDAGELTSDLDKILNRLGELGVLVVAAVHNEYGHKDTRHGLHGFPQGRGDVIKMYPAAFADPAAPDYLSNVLAVGAVDISNRVSIITPFQK